MGDVNASNQGILPEGSLVSLFGLLEKETMNLFRGESSGHDIYHLIRVRRLALEIQKYEGGDRLVVGVAAFLHDIHRAMSVKQGRYVAPDESLELVEEIISKVIELPLDIVKKILHCIEHHEEYSFGVGGKIAQDLETQIVQDADNLDAIGAIGVARAFMYGGARKIPMYLPGVPLEATDGYTEARENVSEIHHFYDKMLRIPDDMNTETGRRLAISRHQFVESFLRQFFDEWNQEI